MQTSASNHSNCSRGASHDAEAPSLPSVVQKVDAIKLMPERAKAAGSPRNPTQLVAPYRARTEIREIKGHSTKRQGPIVHTAGKM